MRGGGEERRGVKGDREEEEEGAEEGKEGRKEGEEKGGKGTKNITKQYPHTTYKCRAWILFLQSILM